jgi:ethanolamine ammonia-lyase small subunit
MSTRLQPNHPTDDASGIAASLPLALLEQGRVAIGDDVGERLGAPMVVVLIGERPA